VCCLYCRALLTPPIPLALLQVAACVSLMGALVQSGSGPSRSDPRQAQASSMPVEVLRAMREAGAVKALAQALNLVSTEHPQVGHCCRCCGCMFDEADACCATASSEPAEL
jgi:hypothetical protein